MGRLVAEAAASSEVTHAHPDGIAGAVAVAAAGEGAWRIGMGQLKRSPLALLEYALEHTPAGPTREQMGRASRTLAGGSPSCTGTSCRPRRSSPTRPIEHGLKTQRGEAHLPLPCNLYLADC